MKITGQRQVREQHELKRWIQKLRRPELLCVLKLASLDSEGLKYELVERIMQYLDGNPTEQVVRKILVYRANVNCASQMNTKPEANETHQYGIRSVPVLNGGRSLVQSASISTYNAVNNFTVVGNYLAQGQSYTSSQQPSPGRNGMQILDAMVTICSSDGAPPLRLPKYPSITMESSPFYEHIGMIGTPQLLISDDLTPRVLRRIYEKKLPIRLGYEACHMISKHRRGSSNRIEYGVQVLVRFACVDSLAYDGCNPLDARGMIRDAPDALPVHLAMWLNGLPIHLPPTLASNKPGMDGRRSPRGISVTHLLQLTASSSNELRVQWTHVGSYNCVTVQLVRRVTPRDLCQSLLKEVKSPSFTKHLIRTKLHPRSDEDDIVMTTTLPATLSCPVGMSRITIPIRGLHCKHLQCFDASVYLSMNDRKASWRCPICDADATFRDLYVDGLFMEILGLDRYKDVQDVIFNADGSYRVAPRDTNGSRSSSIDQTENSVSVSKKSSELRKARSPPHEPSASKGAAPSEAVIDLTGSDDEADQRPLSTATVSSVAASGSSSSSAVRPVRRTRPKEAVIVLSDSDSEDSTSTSSRATTPMSYQPNRRRWKRRNSPPDITRENMKSPAKRKRKRSSSSRPTSSAEDVDVSLATKRSNLGPPELVPSVQLSPGAWSMSYAHAMGASPDSTTFGTSLPHNMPLAGPGDYLYGTSRLSSPYSPYLHPAASPGTSASIATSLSSWPSSCLFPANTSYAGLPTSPSYQPSSSQSDNFYARRTF